MESPAMLSIPRLRISRNAHAYERPLPSSARDHFPEPVDTLADAPTEDSEGNDRDDDQESTPRMSSTALLDTTETPAARLRALLARSPASSKSTPMPLPPSRSSDIESDLEPLDASYESTPSAARESLKDIFSRAMRDPGNTPQKEKINPRRNSINTSEVDASPRMKHQRFFNKGKRKSLSDEETDPAKTSETSFRSSQAATFDILRERLINSHSQLKDLRFPDSINHDSIPADDNDAMFLRSADISTTTPPVATSTPQQSLHMFIDSHLPSQSNLLDRDSEMQRAFEGFESSDTEGASHRPVSFPPSVVSAHQTQKPPSSELTRSLSSQEPHTTDSSHASASGTKGQHATPRPGFSRFILDDDLKVNGSGHVRDWSQPRIPSEIPSVGPSSSRNFSRQRSFDKDSSEGSSQSDYQDKGGELDREHNTEHERNWNKSRPLRPTSSLHLPPTAERGQIRSLIHADSMSLMSTRTPQRHHSPTGSSRANLPVGSSDDEESVHEGGSNWNASRPKWTHGTPRPVPPFEPQSPGVKESLKTLATRKEESSQRSHTTNEGRIRDGSTAFARAASPTSRFNSSPSPHLPPHDTTQSQKLQLNGTVLQCPPSSSKAKGKGKALDHSLSSGFSFVKKRIPLEPMELETDESGQDEMSQRKDLLSSPTRSSKVSAGISIRSPKKFKPPPKASIRSSSPVSNVKALDTHDTESKPTFLDVLSMANTDRNESSEARNLSQEQTPTIRSTPFPSLETLENPPPPRPSSPLQLSNDKLEQSRIILQRKLGYNHTTISSEPQTQMPHMLQEISPLPSLPLQSPPRNSHVKPASPLLTPPKRPSTSQTEFQTPSPPKNMPDLPGPPTSSEDEAAEEYRAPGHLRSDLTAMKTPRPPGAWTSTPAFQRKTSRPSLSESNAGQELSNRSQTPDHVHKANSTTTKTLRPPGSWASTPIPFSSREQNLSHSGNPKEEHENGLLTPGVSFSTGPSLYAQTPAPPGAYVVTPARKKGIAKVRFDDVSDSGSVGSMTREPLEDITNASSSKATSCTTLPQVDTPQRADLATPVSPVPRRTKSQTSPGIRVLDAFGREFVRDEAGKAVDKAKNKNGIRIVDALGREVEDIDQPSHLTTTEESVPEPSTPLKHDEALLRVRQGLADLVNDLDEMDKLEKNGQELDYTRLEKLQQTSAETQIARARVSAAISSNAEDIKKKLKSLRASMKESKLFTSSTGGRRWQASWIFFFFLVVQLALVIAIYRISVTRAQDLFLTTYYDPFYPDLHLYITKPDTLQFSMHDSSRASWDIIPYTFYLEGWKASTLQIWHNLSIMVSNWQQLLWENVGEGPPQISWPPT
ncbi:hypothetical protein E4T56_gene5117 [Termitomyces sp. T112]|nr:hypothetical protein E4T56_gene5117 [Termitomyces sp. T112]